MPPVSTKVLKNIKGELVEDMSIRIFKTGAEVDGVSHISQGTFCWRRTTTMCCATMQIRTL
ncbi:MAG: hypothetical protein FWG10_06135 [Eubacteriaceae bacterium]|nr:hypothetical protein [Eubacteriaceae bacterium]